MTDKTKQKITADLVLEYYDKSKKSRGDKKDFYLKTAIELSKHLNEWLVIPDSDSKKS